MSFLLTCGSQLLQAELLSQQPSPGEGFLHQQMERKCSCLKYTLAMEGIMKDGGRLGQRCRCFLSFSTQLPPLPGGNNETLTCFIVHLPLSIKRASCAFVLNDGN